MNGKRLLELQLLLNKKFGLYPITDYRIGTRGEVWDIWWVTGKDQSKLEEALNKQGFRVEHTGYWNGKDQLQIVDNKL